MEKQALLESFQDVLNSTTSIKLHADRVADFWEKSNGIFTDEDQETMVSRIRIRVQGEALHSLSGTMWQALYMATGVGKSKILIDLAKSIVSFRPSAKILIVVPTEKLRDNGWAEEFAKWGASEIYQSNVVTTCYASLAKIESEHWSLVGLDEGHNITERNVEFFKKNTVSKVVLLTATKPTDLMKLELLRELNISPAYTLSLDEATKLGIVAPYTITVVTMYMDTTEKYLKAGSTKKGYFYNTEKNHYNYLSRGNMLYSPMGHINRMRFIYTLRSKTREAKWLLENVIPKDARKVIFCGSKDQANELSPYRFYSKPTPPKRTKAQETNPKKLEKYVADSTKYEEAIKHYQGDGSLNKFLIEEINEISCVEALNEGHNLPNLDIGFIVQLNSNQNDFVQRLGRLIRYRVGHTGKIIILCVCDTVDKKWVEKALASIKVAKIEWLELSRLKMGIDTITF